MYFLFICIKVELKAGEYLSNSSLKIYLLTENKLNLMLNRIAEFIFSILLMHLTDL